MILRRTKTGAAGASLKRRREEVLHLLSAYGLARGPRRLSHADERAGHRALSLRMALESLGPVFTAFGLYISTRVDLLTAAERRELASIKDQSPPMHPELVHELLGRELSAPPETVFQSFEVMPLASRLFSQAHRARLCDGRNVVVKLARHASHDGFMRDLELLPSLAPALTGSVRGDASFEVAVEDFRLSFVRKLDLSGEAEDFECMAADAEEFGLLYVPAVHGELCTKSLLVVERPVGECLRDLLARAEAARTEAPPVFQDERADAGDVARRLSVVWLRQALQGGLFPVEFSSDEIFVLPDKRIAFAGGLFASLPGETRSNLWRYLLATAFDDPDKAHSFISRELLRDGTTSESHDLRQRFRQAATFHAGEAFGDYGRGLAARLSSHWSLAGECALASRAGLTAFYRGIFEVAGLTRRLAPERDVLNEALQDVRLIAEIERFKGMLAPDCLGEHLGRYAAVGLSLPREMDEALTQAAVGDRRMQTHRQEPAGRRARRNSNAKVAALLLALASFMLLSNHPSISVLGAWAEETKSLIFLALGAMVLRAASRA